jgi:hypothetical protein
MLHSDCDRETIVELSFDCSTRTWIAPSTPLQWNPFKRTMATRQGGRRVAHKLLTVKTRSTL